MPLIFNDYFQPRSQKTALLLEEDLKGGFKSVAKIEDLQKIKVSSLKKGMLVFVQEDETVYDCIDLKYDYNDDGDEIVTATWDKFVVPATVDPNNPDVTPVSYTRPTKSINFSYVKAGSVVNIPVNMGCKSFIITSLKVTDKRKINLKIFSRLDRKDVNPYEFDTTKGVIDRGTTFLQDGSKFMYRKFPMLINEETRAANSKLFLFQCTSLERGAYTTSMGLEWTAVNVEMTYIPMES